MNLLPQCNKQDPQKRDNRVLANHPPMKPQQRCMSLEKYAGVIGFLVLVQGLRLATTRLGPFCADEHTLKPNLNFYARPHLSFRCAAQTFYT